MASPSTSGPSSPSSYTAPPADTDTKATNISGTVGGAVSDLAAALGLNVKDLGVYLGKDKEAAAQDTTQDSLNQQQLDADIQTTNIKQGETDSATLNTQVQQLNNIQSLTVPGKTANELTPVQVAGEINVRLQNLAEGKGLTPIQADTPENKVGNASIVEQNNAIQAQQVADLKPLLSLHADNLQKAFTVLGNPKPSSPDDELAAKALIRASTPSAVGGGGGSVQYNAFLGGLVGIALFSAMTAYMKTQMVGEKVSQEMWSQNMTLIEDVTNQIANNIKANAKAEAIEHIIQAACAAGAMVAQVGGGMGSMMAKDMQMGMGAQLAGQGFATLFTGVLQNMALAPIDILKGDLQAQKALLDMQKEFISQIMTKCDDMQKSNAQNFDAFNDALKDYLSKIQGLVTKLSGH